MTVPVSPGASHCEVERILITKGGWRKLMLSKWPTLRFTPVVAVPAEPSATNDESHDEIQLRKRQNRKSLPDQPERHQLFRAAVRRREGRHRQYFRRRDFHQGRR